MAKTDEKEKHAVLPGTNGATNEDTQEADEDKIDETISLEVLEAVDLDLSGEYLDEILANEMLQVITSYHQTQIQLKAYRHNEDGPNAEKARKLMMTLKSQAALIQHEHPGTIPIYKDLATIRARSTKKARANTLED